MKFDVTRPRMWPASMAAWILLTLLLSANSGSACVQASEISGATSGFSAAFNLTSRQDPEPFRVWLSDQSFRESPAFIGVMERCIPPYPDSKPLRIWFVHPFEWLAFQSTQEGDGSPPVKVQSFFGFPSSTHPSINLPFQSNREIHPSSFGPSIISRKV